MAGILVAVGSTNRTKIEAVQNVFRHYYPDCEVTGFDVASGVSDQPISEEEMFTGAETRASTALILMPEAHFGVGIEGGLRKAVFGWFESSLIVIKDNHGRIGIGSSGGLALPDVVLRRIESGENLEQAVDVIFGTKNIGESAGMFGVMTKGLVTRASGVEHGVAFALARFLHDKVYDQK